MKKIIAFNLFCIAALAQQVPGGFAVFDKNKTREQIGHILVPNGSAPNIQQLIPRFTNYHKDVKRTKVRYGPYRLGLQSESTLISLLTGEKGTVSYNSIGVTKPCSGKCSLVSMQAGLEYANGSVADVSNGAWLHHVVLITGGSGHKDGTCPGSGLAMLGERTFSSGNERTPTTFGDIVNGTIKAGFPIAPSDIFTAQLELMNMNNIVKNVYLTIDFEYIPGDLPSGFKRARAMWLDVSNCGISFIKPPSGKMKFKLPSQRWTVGYNGDMLGVGGHLHDGGTVLNIYKNDQKICTSHAKYSVASGHSHGRLAVEKRQANGPSVDGKPHIKEMTTCAMMGSVKSTDKIWIEAEYDFNQHEGTNTEVMGIAIMYLAADV